MSDLATELLRALELALPRDRDELALRAQLDRVEQAMADAIDCVLAPDEVLEAVA